jgi:hypothetical protein
MSYGPAKNQTVPFDRCQKSDGPQWAITLTVSLNTKVRVDSVKIQMVCGPYGHFVTGSKTKKNRGVPFLTITHINNHKCNKSTKCCHASP